jgi:thiamine-phosphate pyrophosphorylase
MTRRLPSRLYAIADGGAGRDVVDLTARLLSGGARIVQLRWKDAPAAALFTAGQACRRLTRERGALLLINDRVDVAIACDADGVHLGQSDLPLPAARRLLGEPRWIGVSTHDLPQARAAAGGGADYIGFGPLFATGTKTTGYSARGLDRLREVRHAVGVPIVGIGGIDARLASDTIRAGADAVAMISAIRDAPDPCSSVRELLAAIGDDESP